MFGYDTACISSILIFLDSGSLDLSYKQKEIVTGMTSVGSFFGSLGASVLTDKMGRKSVLTVCCVIFTLAAIQLGFCQSVISMIWGRLVVGFAVGAASMVVPVYISEVAPSKRRGTLLALNSISTTGGQFLANIAALCVASSKYNWRLMFLFSGIPPVLFLLVVGFIPESPRYLILHQEYDKAELAISNLYPYASAEQVQSKVSSIAEDIRLNEERHNLPLHSRLFGSGATIRALAVGCGLMFYQQASSFNSFMYYGATIFKMVGVGNPLVVSILISGTNFGFTFVALWLIDRVGRRSILLRTVWIMSLSLFVAGIAFSKVRMPQSTEALSVNSYSVLLLVSVLSFVASYASALGTVPWSSVEFLPLEARAPGCAIIAATGWLTNSLVSVTYLSLVDLTSLSATSIIFSVICLAGWLAVYKWYPEVNGLSLEDIRYVFEDGIDIHYVSRRGIAKISR
jgi:SP family myo-inositol transporter-like MFS transporter 13